MDAPMTTQLSKLRKLSLKELQEKHREVFGAETKSRDRKDLFVKIAKKLQDNEEPESANKPVALPTLIAKFEREKKTRSRNVSKTTKKVKTEKGKKQVRPIGERDKRLPKSGTTISREWHGRKYLVKVLEKGFEYNGKPYGSLSGIANHITGQIVNGYAWFDLNPTEDKKS